jgi:hypothetical protein
MVGADSRWFGGGDGGSWCLLSTQPAMEPALLGAVLFGGMALVFYLIYLLAAERQRFAWALAPATALGVMGLAALAAHLAASSPALADCATALARRC